MATSAQTDIGLLLARAYQEFVRELRAALAAQGFADLGRSDGYVLRALVPGPMTVSRLAARLVISKQGAAQIVDDMERRAYVRHGTDPEDGRARPVELAARGRRAVDAASSFHRAYERTLVRRHGRQTVADVRSLLTAMSGGATDAVDPQLRALYL